MVGLRFAVARAVAAEVLAGLGAGCAADTVGLGRNHDGLFG